MKQLPLLVLLLAGCASQPPLPAVQANDNRVAGGQLHGDTLDLRLVVQMATWRPESDSAKGIAVAAFAEAGRAPQIPAPLIRVRAGTIVTATIRNSLADSTITLYGLHTRPAERDDSVVIHPGDSARVSFPAGTAGTYLYGAVLGKHDFDKDDEREQLGGAFVVDPVEGSPPDRVLVMNIWSETIDSNNGRNALAINGRSWPYDEQYQATTGDTIRWRVVNASNRGHPMHLHGFYYDVLARGDSRRDTTYLPADRRMVVTEQMRSFSTMNMQWVPTRPGHWLFHCHIAFHVIPEAARLAAVPPEAHESMSDDPRIHMAGLVVGISVGPRAEWRAAARPDPRQLRLFIQEGKPPSPKQRALGFVLQRDGRAPARDSVEIPGSVLVLTRGQPTNITVINRLKESSAIHWHGIELESWSDGVAGWSGDAQHAAPSIQPGDSFVAHLTLPRAGTFIYHTHMHDLEQLTSGLYGAIVVLEPGQAANSSTDHLMLAGSDSHGNLLINGDTLTHYSSISAGTTHRLRFVNIGAADAAHFTLVRDTIPVIWQALAKDGADLPANQATMRAALVKVRVGETYDFAWRPTPGTYRLLVGPPEKPRLVQEIVVR